MSDRRVRRGAAVLTAVALLLAGCGVPVGGDRTLEVYTSVTQETVDAVVAAFAEEHPDVTVNVFRAPTGELNARIAAERRQGRVRADVLWLTDPPSMQQYAADGLLRSWEPDGLSAVPEAYRTDTFWGTRILDIVLVHGTGVEPVPTSWQDMTDAAYRNAVAIPDPGFAGSAFGALGYFALADGFGLEFYRALALNGAEQVQAPGDVVTGVAEGRYAVGMTLGQTARTAIDAGSPIAIVYPEPGAVAIYSPISVLDGATNMSAAEAFVEFVFTPAAQLAIADTGWQPVRTDVPWPIDAPQVQPDWPAIFDRQEELLDEYRRIFGG